MIAPRRSFLLAAAAALSGCAGAPPKPSPSEALLNLERSTGGRLGVAVLAPDGGVVGHRLEERFAMCSTFKLPLAALVLSEADAGRLSLDEPIAVTRADLISYAPITERAVERGSMSVAALARAAQVESDNVAANLLLRRLGGPAAFTAKLRGLGDQSTRLDRFEPELNIVLPGDPRDTTTPDAMARLVAAQLAGLAPRSRALLQGWMIATETGRRRLRDGLPGGWRVGDKTGTWTGPGASAKINDVAAVFRRGRPPMVIAAFYETAAPLQTVRAEDEAVLAAVGRIVGRSL